MAKNLDGIKKLNPDDIKKYRKIVLNYIGEKNSTEAPEQKDFSQTTPSLRRVDGVNLNKVNRLAAKNKKRLPKPSAEDNLPSASPGARPVELIETLNEKKPELAKPSRLEAERLKEAVKRQEEERKKIKTEERRYQLEREQAEKDRREREESLKQEEIRLEKEHVEQERIKRQEEIAKIKLVKRAIKQKAKEDRRAKRQESIKKIRQNIKNKFSNFFSAIKQKREKIKEEKERKKQEKRKIFESLRLERIKRQEEIAKMKLETKIARQVAKEKKRSKRQKAWGKTKKNLRLKSNDFFSKIKKNIIYIIAVIILFLAIAYIVFCLAVLRFNNNSIGRAANYLPVPAALTSRGIISYNDFRKIENRSYLNLTLSGKKNYLAEWIVSQDLRDKYILSTAAIKDDLAIKYVLDKDFNQIGLSRVNKINELLKDQSGFEQLGKYADEYNDGVYYGAKIAVSKFGSAVLDLAVGQVSNIIPRADGYYIIKRIDDRKGQLGLKYIFIKALTLDQYIASETSKMKIFILAN